MRQATRNRLQSALDRLTAAGVATDDAPGLLMAMGHVAVVQYDFPWLLHELRWELEEKERTLKAQATSNGGDVGPAPDSLRSGLGDHEAVVATAVRNRAKQAARPRT